MIQPLPNQRPAQPGQSAEAAPQKLPVLKELKCPNCGGPLAQSMPTAQTLVCSRCGSYVGLGAQELKILGKGQKLLSPPVPINVGQRFTLGDASYFVMGRVQYEGWDDEDRWRWTEWLLGSSDGRLLWLAYDTEDGFVLFRKVKLRQAFDPMRDASIPTGDGHTALVKERYPARILGAEGELTFRAVAGDKLTMVEGARSGKKYSVQVTPNELEVYEGTPLNELAVAQALGSTEWVQRLESHTLTRQRQTVIGVICVAFATLGFIAAAAASRTGEIVARQTVQLTGAAPQATFPVNFSSANRPAIITLRLLNPMAPGAVADVDVSIISPNDIETFVYDQEFYHATGVDGGESWTEIRRDGQDLFVPYLTGEHTIELTLDVPKPADNLSIEVVVRQNHVVPGWFLGYGLIVGIIGLTLVLTGQGISFKLLLIIGAVVAVFVLLLASGVEVFDIIGDILEFLGDA